MFRRMKTPRTPSPKNVIKVRRLPRVGDRIVIEAEVTRVDEAEGAHHGRVTYRVPGATAPITVAASFIPEQDD